VVPFVLALGACGGEDGPASTGPPDAIIVGDLGTGSGDVGLDAGPQLDPCTDNLDCRGGEVCRASFCRVACTDNDACGPASPWCDVERGFCVGCRAVEDCDGPGAQCVESRCVFGCGDDEDCGDGERCTNDARCVVPECARDADCRGGFRCRDFECRPIDPVICTAERVRCDANDLVTCNRDGTRETRAACDDAVCVEHDGAASCRAIVCSAEEVTCLDAATAGLCDATGTRWDPLPCRDTQYCDAGACRARVCVPNSAVCDGDTVVTCDTVGRTETRIACATVAGCEGPAGCGCVAAECVPRLCVPDSRRCVGNGAQRCNDRGDGYDAPVACEGEDVCQSGACVSPRCEPGAAECSGETLLTCDSDERTRIERDCRATGGLCTGDAPNARCEDAICVPSSVRCSADRRDRITCDTRGATETRVPCAEGLFCDGGACRELACDPRSCAELDAAGLPRTDTDGDGIPDCIEGTDIGPNGQPACADPDQDGDGLLDGEEPVCPGVDTIRTADSDDDGWDDLLEVLAGSDPCDPNETPEDLADTVLVVGDDRAAQTLALTLQTTSPPIDVAFLVDTTGSMGGELIGLVNNTQTDLITPMLTEFPTTAWAVTRYDDFPCGPASTATGNAGDLPFALVQRVTTNTAAILTALGALQAAGGADFPESTHEALYQLATGVGVSGCGATVPPFNPATNRVVGVADGPRPGAGFRVGAVPVIVHVTDAVAQTGDRYPEPFWASRTDATTAVRDTLGGRYVGINSKTSTDVTSDLRGLATAMDSALLPCAWGTDRPAGCGSTQCCTGVAGAGVEPVGGRCLPVTVLGSRPTQLPATIRHLVRGAARGLAHEVRLTVRRVGTGPAATTIFPTLRPTSATAGTQTCPLPTLAGTVWQNTYPGTQLAFDATLAPATLPARSSTTYEIEAKNVPGGLLGTHRVLLLVR
jgi:hypothetical protein